MKRLLTVLLLFACCFVPLPGSAAQHQQRQSLRTFLIAVDDQFRKKDLHALLQRYQLKTVYAYKNFSMYALAADRDLTPWRMNRLLKKIAREPHILSAQPDYIMELDHSKNIH